MRSFLFCDRRTHIIFLKRWKFRTKLGAYFNDGCVGRCRPLGPQWNTTRFNQHGLYFHFKSSQSSCLEIMHESWCVASWQISHPKFEEVQYINFYWNSLATRQNLAPRTPKEGICHSSSSSGHSSYWSIKWVAGGCIWLSNLALAAPAENESITAVTALALCWGSWLQIDKVFFANDQDP